ncbi:uncharacterized protein LOC130550742 isoform X2 [Triplophysa rosa]|uniref:uncharacterized protein LOC130550742 isoform X2 n=1 Tax=Triplophysa rosa TaxID=992332 RepID=UPI0025461CE8|nr:uncharacterized protein LOC130550742 isoform X2 [Triplophysa rosa]XP_057184228.1 uncharacterized protein LOC130550742 isoform X2 [Triplophysa rosa]
MDISVRMYDHQRVPSTVSPLSYGSNGKQLCSTSSSLSSHRCSRKHLSSRSSRPHSSSRAKLKMEDLQTIKRELTVIKMQIDGLLDSLDRMDRQRQESTASPLSQNDSLGGSLSHPSASSPEVSPRSLSPHCRIHRDSLELGEASDEDTVHTMFLTELGVVPQVSEKVLLQKVSFYRAALRAQRGRRSSMCNRSWRQSLRVFRKRWNEPRREGPYTVIPVTPTTVQVEGRNTWYHLNHCTRVPQLHRRDPEQANEEAEELSETSDERQSQDDSQRTPERVRARSRDT